MKFGVIALVLLALACSKAEGPSEAAKPGAAMTTPAVDPEPTEKEANLEPAASNAPTPGAAVVKLLDAGKPPRREIHWQFQEGAVDVLKLKNVSVMRATSKDFDGTERTGTPQIPRGMLQKIAVTTRAVSDDGTAAVEFRVLEDTLLKTPNPTPGVSITPAKGAHGTYTVSSSGVVSGFELVLPPGFDSAQAERLEYVENILQLTVVPVPAEPVGEGAKWSVTRDMKRRGASMSEQIVIELVDRADSRIVLAWKLTSTNKTDDAVRSGRKSSEYKWDADGRTTSVLTRLAPLRSDFDNVAHLHTEFVNSDGKTQILDVIVDRQVEMRGR